MRFLVVSPIASHPQDQGNSARIHAFCRELQSTGHQVHFFYYPMEGLSPAQRDAMAREWDGFHTTPCHVVVPPLAPGATYRIDDWCDPAAGRLVAELHARWSFDAVVVNYVWFSGVLDALPDNLLKIIDTHDVFGDRHLTFERMGLPPEWFFTTPEEERRGLARAHVAIAIQDEEAAHFMGLLRGTRTEVVTVGFPAPIRFLPDRVSGTRVVAGYLGSGNPLNVSSIETLARTAPLTPRLAQHFDIRIAGTICRRLGKLPPPFHSVGLVDEPRDLYAEIDVALNPMIGGTGLKIKTLEALSFGLPVVGTPDAWVGIGDPGDVWPGGRANSVLGMLDAIAIDRSVLGRLRSSCRTIYTSYLLRHRRGFEHLLFRTERHRRRHHAAHAAPARRPGSATAAPTVND